MKMGKVLMLEADTRFLLPRSRVLSVEGYDITGVSSFEEAVELAKQQPFDLLIVTVEEPGFLKLLLSQLPPDLSVLIIASEELIARTVECSGTGIHSFLIQPFGVDKFKDTVEYTVTRASLVKQKLKDNIMVSLGHTSNMLASEEQIDRFLDLVVGISASNTRADFVSLSLKDEVTGKFVDKAHFGDYRPIPESVYQQAIKNRGAPVLFDASTCYDSPLFRSLAEARISAILCIPLTVGRRVIGLISNVKATNGKGFTLSDQGFISILGWCTALVLENVKLSSQCQKQSLRLGKLLHEVSLAQENERRRVAADIHDSVVQWILGASYGIKACSALATESGLIDLSSELSNIEKTLQRSITELRRVIANLRPLPLEKLGLVAALQYITKVVNDDGIRCHTEVLSKSV